jgi:hypothetical protein
MPTDSAGCCLQRNNNTANCHLSIISFRYLSLLATQHKFIKHPEVNRQTLQLVTITSHERQYKKNHSVMMICSINFLIDGRPSRIKIKLATGAKHWNKIDWRDQVSNSTSCHELVTVHGQWVKSMLDVTDLQQQTRDLNATNISAFFSLLVILRIIINR